MSVTAAAIGIAAVGGYAFLKTKTDNIPADLRFVWRLIRGKREATALVNRGDWSIADFWEEHYAKGCRISLSCTLSYVRPRRSVDDLRRHRQEVHLP